MLKKQTQFRYFLLSTPVVFLSLLFYFVITNTAHALTISPARIELNGDKGQTLSGEIEIINEESTAKTFYTSYENFESRGDSGAPYFIGSKDGLATWISTSPSVQINKGEKKIIPYSVSIPENAESGGYFAAIFFGTSPVNTQSGGEVSIGGRIGALILLRVNGEIKEGGGLNEFTTKGKQRFFSGLPITFSYKLNNTGGDRVVPRGEIKFKNTLRITTEKISANEREGSVLPNSTRKFDVTWGDADSIEKENPGFFGMAWRQLTDFHLGWYTAKISLNWGETNQTGGASYNFFIIPWQLLIIVIIVLFCVYLVIKKYNKYIISKAIKSINKK